MEDYGTRVQLLAFTTVEQACHIFGWQDGEALIEYAGRKCYANEDKCGTDPDWIQARIKDGHESILEHASATFLIVCSRVVTHELVRHRIASYSQRSQRYVKESEPRYIIPAEIRNAETETPDGEVSYEEWFRHVMELAWNAYESLINQGFPGETARYVLPNACETQIVVTMNFRELRHFIKLRTLPRVLPEMGEVAGKVKDICRKIAPKVFEDL